MWIIGTCFIVWSVAEHDRRPGTWRSILLFCIGVVFFGIEIARW